LPFINLPPSLQQIISNIENRLAKLELSKRFTFPAVTTDPTNPRIGDAWLNTASNTPKYVNSSGTVATFGGGTSVPYGPRYMKTGFQYGPISVGSLTNNVPTASLLTAVPIYVPNAVTVTQLMISIGATAGTTSGIRVGLYTNSATDDYPNTLVTGSDQFIATDTVSASAGAAGATVSLSLTAGLYWLAAVKQGTGSSSVACLTSANYYDYSVFPYSLTTGGGVTMSPMVAWSGTPYASALPTTFPNSATHVPTSSASVCVWIAI
jgi:hypothetical protein